MLALLFITGASAMFSPAAGAANVPDLSWQLPRTGSAGQPVTFTWRGRNLESGSRLVVQKPEGTAHVWRTIMRLDGTSGSAALPALTLGKYRFRIAALSGRRVLAKQGGGIAIFGQVPFSTLFGVSESSVLTTPTGTFPWIAHWEYDPQPAISVEENPCLSVHISFVASEYHAHGNAAISVVQESREPVSATAPFETIGSLDAELVLGQTWAVNVLTRLEAEEFYTYLNGYAICDSSEAKAKLNPLAP